MLLGAVDVSPLETAQLFNGLANGGFRSPLRAVRAVISAQGKPLKAFPLEVTQVASPESIYPLDRMLVLVMEHGTGRAARAMLPPQLLSPASRVRPRTCATAGLPVSPAATWWSYGWATTTTIPRDSPDPPVRCRCGRTSWRSSTPPPGTAPMPESLAEVHIEYPTGLRVVPGCAQDIVAVVVPGGAQLPARPGCGFPDTPPPGAPAPVRSCSGRSNGCTAWGTDAPVAGRSWPPCARCCAHVARCRRAPRKDPGPGAPGSPVPPGAAPPEAPYAPPHGSFTWAPPPARSSPRRTARPRAGIMSRRPPRSSAPCGSSPTTRWYGSSSAGCAWRKTMACRRMPWGARHWRSPPATPPRRPPPGVSLPIRCACGDAMPTQRRPIGTPGASRLDESQSRRCASLMRMTANGALAARGGACVRPPSPLDLLSLIETG